MTRVRERRFERYVAIGDSTTEGLDDPDGVGGYRGWADRLAEHVARSQGSLLYANLALRGRRTRQIRDEQLDRAIALRPDLATLSAGTNDVISPGFDLAAVASDIEYMQRALVNGGATLLVFTMPDMSRVMPSARVVASRLRQLNVLLREISADTGAVLLDFEAHDITSDRRLWSEDRLHANTAGHTRIAGALAQALGLPGADDSWLEPLPLETPTSALRRLVAEIEWARRHLLPWIWRRLRGRSSGNELEPKRPALEPVRFDGSSDAEAPPLSLTP